MLPNNLKLKIDWEIDPNYCDSCWGDCKGKDWHE